MKQGEEDLWEGKGNLPSSRGNLAFWQDGAWRGKAAGQGPVGTWRQTDTCKGPAAEGWDLQEKGLMGKEST